LLQQLSRVLPGARRLLRLAERLGHRVDERADRVWRRVCNKPERCGAIKKHERLTKRRAGEVPRIDADQAAIGLDSRTERGQAKRVLGLAAKIMERRRGRIQRGLVGASCMASSQVPSSDWRAVNAGRLRSNNDCVELALLIGMPSISGPAADHILSLPHSYAD
jgi:hypothetical protein